MKEINVNIQKTSIKRFSVTYDNDRTNLVVELGIYGANKNLVSTFSLNNYTWTNEDARLELTPEIEKALDKVYELVGDQISYVYKANKLSKAS